MNKEINWEIYIYQDQEWGFGSPISPKRGKRQEEGSGKILGRQKGRTINFEI